MDIKNIFKDSRIVMLEEDIVRINEQCDTPMKKRI